MKFSYDLSFYFTIITGIYYFHNIGDIILEIFIFLYFKKMTRF